MQFISYQASPNASLQNKQSTPTPCPIYRHYPLPGSGHNTARQGAFCDCLVLCSWNWRFRYEGQSKKRFLKICLRKILTDIPYANLVNYFEPHPITIKNQQNLRLHDPQKWHHQYPLIALRARPKQNMALWFYGQKTRRWPKAKYGSMVLWSTFLSGR